MQKYRTLKCDSTGIHECACLIRDGGVVVYPTDTVYGIGCDPRNDAAVARVFEIKKRDSAKALPVLVRDASAAESLVRLGPISRLLVGKYWPGALTIVAPLREPIRISRKVSAYSNELAVRVPANKCLLAVLRQIEMIVGTSANLSGETSPSSTEEVIDSGLAGFDALLDGGSVDAKGIGSTIIRELDGAYKASSAGELTDKIQIIREGAIRAGELMSTLDSILEQDRLPR